jgi:hypothetical protein
MFPINRLIDQMLLNELVPINVVLLFREKKEKKKSVHLVSLNNILSTIRYKRFRFK